MWIKLVTKDGGLVGYVTILPFQIPPEAVAWGSRIFILDSPRREEEGATVYREGLLYVLPAKPNVTPEPEA
jgi:hypothetical protein